MNWFKRWRKELFIIFGVIALAVGGVIVANELGKTGDIALDDDFTSSFIDQDVKVDEGFHFFESKNGKYTMWLPAGYYLVGERGNHLAASGKSLVHGGTERRQGQKKHLTHGMTSETM